MSGEQRTKAPRRRHSRGVSCVASWLAASWLVLGTTACSDNGMTDLRQFVDQAKEKKGRVEPLPEFKPVETFSYEAQLQRDPFGAGGPSPTLAAGDQAGGSQLTPDIDRRKEILETYPLDTLRMMGTFEFKDARWGLVKAPDGIVYRVRPGSHMGQNYGKVQAVQDKKIMLTEIVPDGLGGWLQREAYLAINEQ